MGHIAISKFRNHQQIDEERIDVQAFAKEIDLMMRMTHEDPSKRPTAHSLIMEPFVQFYWMKNVLKTAIPSTPSCEDEIIFVKDNGADKQSPTFLVSSPLTPPNDDL